MPINIKDAIDQSGLTRKEFCEKLGFGYSSVWQWARQNDGNFPDKYEKKVAKFLEKNQVKFKAKKKVKFEEIKDAPTKKEDAPMVALVGSAKDVMNVLSNLKLTKD